MCQQADSRAAAALVLRSCPEQHANVVASLAQTPRLQYLYLKGAMQARTHIHFHPFCPCRLGARGMLPCQGRCHVQVALYVWALSTEACSHELQCAAGPHTHMIDSTKVDAFHWSQPCLSLLLSTTSAQLLTRGCAGLPSAPPLGVCASLCPGWAAVAQAEQASMGLSSLKQGNAFAPAQMRSSLSA